MRLTASFQDGFLSLLCEAESPAEQAMIGAVINQPNDGYQVDNALLMAELKYDAHFTHKKVKSLRLTVQKYHEHPPAE